MTSGLFIASTKTQKKRGRPPKINDEQLIGVVLKKAAGGMAFRKIAEELQKETGIRCSRDTINRVVSRYGFAKRHGGSREIIIDGEAKRRRYLEREYIIHPRSRLMASNEALLSSCWQGGYEKVPNKPVYKPLFENLPNIRVL